jgi:uncharacterized membrane protein
MASASDYVEVDASARRCYDYWRDLTHPPNIFDDVEEVTQTGEDTYHWKVTGPAGKTIEWEARITEDVPGSKIAWESTGEGHVETAGNVQFEDKGERCAITVALKYDPPGGVAGEMVTKLSSQDPEKQLRRALESFKDVAEAWSNAA